MSMPKAQRQYIQELETANMALAKKVQQLKETIAENKVHMDQVLKHLYEVEADRDKLRDVVCAARAVLMLGRE